MEIMNLKMIFFQFNFVNIDISVTISVSRLSFLRKACLRCPSFYQHFETFFHFDFDNRC